MVGSSFPHQFDMQPYENYFMSNMVAAPKPCWTATDGIIFAKDLASSSASSGVINCDANDNSFCDTTSKDSLTIKVDEWFEDLIQIDEEEKKSLMCF